jgi:hypothetical protein
MNIENELLIGHSKARALRIANYVDCNKEKLGELLQLFFDNRIIIHQRASMAVGICAERQSCLFYPYLRPMLKNLKNPVHDAVVRATFRIFKDMDLPEELWSDVWEVCYQYLISPRYPVAIRVFAMTVLANICKNVPELKHELQIVIEDQMPYWSAGLKSRGKKTIDKIKKLDLHHI